jgi:hypothetical protein
MKRSTTLRLTGGAIVLVNLWAVGHYAISGLPVLLMTVGVAVAFELLLVRPAIKDEAAAGKSNARAKGRQ